MKLSIGDTSGWHFIGGEWEDVSDGGMKPVPGPKERTEEGMQSYRFAFAKDSSYRNVKLDFHFRQTAHSDVGVIIGARDPSHFAVLHFPCCGQACRSQHFWAALSVMDESGYLRVQKMRMLNRVDSMANTCHRAEIEVGEGAVSAILDGKAVFRASSPALNDGFLGLMMFNPSEIGGIEILSGTSGEVPWNGAVIQPVNWSYPCAPVPAGKWQKPLSLVRTSDNGLLLYFAATEGFDSSTSYYLSRSSDNGYNWSQADSWYSKKNIWHDGQYRVLHVVPDGTLKCFLFDDVTAGTVSVCETTDSGRSWSEPRSVRMGKCPATVDKLNVGPQAFVNLADGAMLFFAYGRVNDDVPISNIYTWSYLHCQAFSFRSTDGGETWSDPVNVDGIVDPKNGAPVTGNMDFTEVCGVEIADGSVVGLIRPMYSPWMWEIRSPDGGRRWQTAVRGPFPGYAAPNMIRTVSGRLVVAHRLTGLTIHTSPDEGMSWDEGAVIDSGIWAMGCMLEVEPDVVLYIYWDSFESQMRMQRFRVSDDGIHPVRP